MNIVVVGPGAMGCLFAAKLKKSGHDVVLVDYKKERVDHINNHGIRLEGASGDMTVHVPASISIPEKEPELVMICVKATKTREAAEAIKTCIGPETMVLTLQNGIGNMEGLAEILGKDKICGGVTSEGATVLGPGHIRHAGKGQTFIGSEHVPKHMLNNIVSALNVAGFSTEFAEDVDSLLWGKLIINVGINALTAITRLKNGMLPNIKGTRAIMEMAVDEAVEVARAKNISLPYPDALGRVIEVCEATATNIASMLQDVLNNRITEVDFINGAIVKEARLLGIETPVNMTLTNLVRAIQETYDKRVENL